MRVSPKQMKAARAMLDWSRSDLSKVSGISEQNIMRLESGGEARPDTMRRIAKAFDDHDIIFNINGGVEPANPTVKTYYGLHGIEILLEDIFAALNDKNGGIYICGVPSKSVIFDQELQNNYWDKISKLNGFSVNYLGENVKKSFLPNMKYTLLFDKATLSIPYIIYSDRIAFIDNTRAIDAPMIIILRSRALSKMYKEQFELLSNKQYSKSQ